MSWYSRTNGRDWIEDCQVDRCNRIAFKCPQCGKKAHRHVWVDLNAPDQVIIVAKHAHFIRAGLRDMARNWYHTISFEKVDPRSFANSRKIMNTEYLPRDIRRIFDER